MCIVFYGRGKRGRGRNEVECDEFKKIGGRGCVLKGGGEGVRIYGLLCVVVWGANSVAPQTNAECEI